MKIFLNNISKKYSSGFTLKDINYEFNTGNIYGISGTNGCGKSTLLKIIASMELPDSGKINYFNCNSPIYDRQINKYLSVVAPYSEVSDYFTLEESIDFHFSFKSYQKNFDKNKVIDMLNMRHISKQMIGTFSSGMKQKLKLVLAMYSDSPLVLLDEPAMNLDGDSIDMFQTLIKDFSKNRLILIFSNNRSEELSLCNKLITTEFFR
ncbi:MAG: ABC transporter ATP-binding protein [Bacteroidota bacterium]|nr:ABC transporter ATP-binding protein [Bacteroidota bacterium]